MRMDSPHIFASRARWLFLPLLIILCFQIPANAQELPSESPNNKLFEKFNAGPTIPTPGGNIQLPDLTKRDNFSAALQIVVLLTVLSLAPAILIMMTSFTRIVIVLSLLRQALGTQQLPPNQILIGLALFMTFVVMGPTWNRVNNEALQPYLEGRIDQKSALSAGQVPLRDFMIGQIRKANNDDDVFLFT